jgi:hypothetical protein
MKSIFGKIEISVDFPGVDVDANISSLDDKYCAFAARIKDYANLIKSECLGDDGKIEVES